MKKKQKWLIALHILAFFSLLDNIFNVLSLLGIFAYTLNFFNVAMPLATLATSLFFIVLVQKGLPFSGPLFTGIYLGLLISVAVIWLVFGCTLQPHDAFILALYPLFWAMGAIIRSEQ